MGRFVLSPLHEVDQPREVGVGHGEQSDVPASGPLVASNLRISSQTDP